MLPKNVCALSIFLKVGRKLIIYDSFQGLPIDEDKIDNRNYPHLKLTGKYAVGMYKATKRDVENNLKIFGEYENVFLERDILIIFKIIQKRLTYYSWM